MAVSPVLVTHPFIEDFPSVYFCSLLQSCTVGVECCQGWVSDLLDMDSNSSAVAAAPDGSGSAHSSPAPLCFPGTAAAGASVLALKQL